MSTTALDPILAKYDEQFAPADDAAKGARTAAFAKFKELGGLPSPRDESWRQTPITSITRGEFVLASAAPSQGSKDGDAGAAAPVDGSRYAIEGAAVLCATNGGEFVTSGALPEAATVSGDGWAAALPDTAGAFTLLNAAFAAAPLSLQVAAGAVIEQPIHLIHVISPGANASEFHSRLRIEVGAGAQCTIVESHLVSSGDTPSFTNHVTELIAGDNAQVEHTTWQHGTPVSNQIGLIDADLGRDAKVALHGFAHAGQVTRNDVQVRFAAPGAEADMNGLYLGGDDGLADFHTRVDHIATGTTSRQLYKGVLSGSARGVFEGHVIIQPGAQVTTATQSNRNLLLSDDAQVHTKPLLEIYADDVQCAHGAAIGQMDEDALFYLRQRGIAAADARHMLAEAFIGEVTAKVRHAAVAAWVGAQLASAHPGEGPA